MTPERKEQLLDQLSYLLSVNEIINTGLFELYTKLSVWEYCYQKDVQLLRDVRKTAKRIQENLLEQLEIIQNRIQAGEKH